MRSNNAQARLTTTKRGEGRAVCQERTTLFLLKVPGKGEEPTRAQRLESRDQGRGRPVVGMLA